MTARQFHLWSGILLGLPMLIVGITAVLLAHEKSLGLPGIAVPFLQMSSDQKLELDASAEDAQGRLWLGGKQGLYVQHLDGRIEKQADLEVKQLLSHTEQLWIASKSGLFSLRGTHLQQHLNGETKGISLLADGRLMANHKSRGALLSEDGESWQAWAGNNALAAAQASQTQPYTLDELVMDLHTGKLLFGKQGEWIWIDLLGVFLCALGLTGVWIWWRSRLRAAG